MTGLLEKFFTIARKNCANYSGTGPGGKPDYCYSGINSCLLREDKFCAYFDRAVIPSKPFQEQGLQLEWQVLWQGTQDRIINKTCHCGEEFRPTSPRQRYCTKCQKLNRTLKARLRKRRQRAKGD